MSLIALIIAVAFASRWLTGRSCKIVLTDDEARAIKAHWWECAKMEMRAWLAVFVGVSFVMAAFGCVPQWYVVAAGITLIIMSRVALWSYMAVNVISYAFLGVTSMLGHPFCKPEQIVLAMTVGLVAFCLRAGFNFAMRYNGRID